MDPLFLAQSRFRRRKFQDCINICDEILSQQPLDQATWLLKTRALTQLEYVDDTEMEETGLADELMDDHAMAKAPRPGTSLRTATGNQNSPSSSLRPLTSSRPMSGYTRTSTGSNRNNLGTAFRGNRPGTMRPISMAGRYVRLGTASMLSSDSNQFINSDNINVAKYAKKPPLAKALCDYLLYVEHNAKKAMELAAVCTEHEKFDDWWWKVRLGKAYYQLGLLRDAEKQFRSALRNQQMIRVYLELGKLFIRLDQPNTALSIYEEGLQHFDDDISLLIGQARIHEELNSEDNKSVELYKSVLRLDPSNVEAMACIACHHFYDEQPELALQLYRRLLQVGIATPELWNNIGLCCLYAGQYDITLDCFERALKSSDDSNAADVWYNISQVALSIGDTTLAQQALSISISIDQNHAESYNNLGILEMKKPTPNSEQAASHFKSAQDIAPYLYEPAFNTALLSFKLGNCEKSFEFVKKALNINPNHDDAKELMKQLEQHLTVV